MYMEVFTTPPNLSIPHLYNNSSVRHLLVPAPKPHRCRDYCVPGAGRGLVGIRPGTGRRVPKVPAPQYDSKWLFKSLRNGSSLNWSISDVQRQSQVKPDKENYNSIPLCKPSSTVENHKEGRASPEQEAEEMEDQYDEEPVSKFAGSLFETQNSLKHERCPRTDTHENNKTTKLKILLKSNGNQQNLLSANNDPLENIRLPEISMHSPTLSQAPLKIPRIILTHPSTSDEDIDQFTQDQDFNLEETDMTEDHLFLDCLNNTPRCS